MKLTLRIFDTNGKLRDALADHPYVREIRHIGLLGGIEFAEPESLDPVGGQPEAFSHAVADRALERGLIARAIWESVACIPPLCVTREESDEIARILIEAVHAATEDFPPVQCVDCRLCVRRTLQFDEGKTTRLASLPVGDDSHLAYFAPVLSEQVAECGLVDRV